MGICSVWTLQYITTTTKDTIRVAVATGNTLENSGAGGFCYYDFNPQQMGFANGHWFDYPHVSVSNNFVWYVTNVFATNGTAGTGDDTYVGTTIWRMPTSALTTCSGFTFNFFTTANGSNTTVEGATDTMYFAGHNSTSQMRLYRWRKLRNDRLGRHQRHGLAEIPPRFRAPRRTA